MKLDSLSECMNGFNEPILINEYRLAFGNVWSQIEMDHAIDLMEVWRICRRPLKMHPLNWLFMAKTREEIAIFERRFPMGSETIEGIPIESFIGTDTEEVYDHSDGFRKDKHYDDGIWLEDFKSLEVNPFIAHQYIKRIYPRYKHTFVPCDIRNTLEYRGYTLRATAKPKDFRPILYDVASLGGLRFRGEKDNEVVAAIRMYRKNKRGTSVMISDMHNYGSHILKTILDHSDFPVLGLQDTLNTLGLSTKQSVATQLGFSPEFVREIFDKMKPVRESLIFTRMGQNPYILVTNEMSKFFVDELIQDGLLMLNP